MDALRGCRLSSTVVYTGAKEHCQPKQRVVLRVGGEVSANCSMAVSGPNIQPDVTAHNANPNAILADQPIRTPSAKPESDIEVGQLSRPRLKFEYVKVVNILKLRRRGPP